MYITEEMISSMEDMQKNASDMEKHIKGMMETEARIHGLELDSRHNARDMWGQLSAHMANMAPVMDELDAVEEALEDEHDPLEHTHEDGTTHSHEGGDEIHSHDDTLPSDVEPPIPGDALVEAETGEDSTQI